MSASEDYRHQRSHRLRERRDFQRVSREGMRVTTPSFLLLVAGRFRESADAPARLGLTVSRKVGGAVVRNQLKRRIREWFRHNRAILPVARDLVVIARPQAAGLDRCTVEGELARAVSRFREQGPR